jgi:hypothetical protein
MEEIEHRVEASKSYSYTLLQKIVSGLCAIAVLSGVIIAGTFLFVNLLDIIVK